MTVIKKERDRFVEVASPKTLRATRLPWRKWVTHLKTGWACKAQGGFDGAAGQVAPAVHRR